MTLSSVSCRGGVVLSVVVLASVGAACAPPADAVEVVQQAFEENPMTGGNAATVGDGLFLDENDLSGKQSNWGQVRFLGAKWGPGGTLGELIIDVSGHTLSARDAAGQTYRGTNLQGATLAFRHDPSGATYEADVLTASYTEFWTQERQGEVPLYGLNVRKTGMGTCDPAAPWFPRTCPPGERFDPDGPPPDGAPVIRPVDPPGDPGRPLCRGDHTDAEAMANPLHYFALVHEGDHIDTVHKTVTDRPLPWFNLACWGTSLAKMHLMRHTRAGAFAAGGWGGAPTTMIDTQVPTSLDERQAMLKMLTADYCATGTRFTTNGHPLWWMDARRWVLPPPAVVPDRSNPVFRPIPSRGYPFPTKTGGPRDQIIDMKVEAIWDPGGAVCLNRPRHVARTAVERDCRNSPGGARTLPFCTIQDTGDFRAWSALGHVISANTSQIPDPP